MFLTILFRKVPIRLVRDSDYIQIFDFQDRYDGDGVGELLADDEFREA